MTLAQMISQLNGLAGLDLTDAEATDLINEGYRELCARSEWLRAYSTSTTVSGQEDYTLPSDCYRVLEVHKNGIPQNASDDETVAQIRAGNYYLVYENYGQSLYWLEGDATGQDHLTLYPTPSSSDSLLIIYVRRPTALTTTDEPVTPREFDRALINYAAYLAYSMLEDDEGAAEIQYGRFERKVEELRLLRNSRSGRGTKRMILQGTHWS